MATIVLSAVGASLGAGFGGAVLGLSGAVLGRAAGAIASASRPAVTTSGGVSSSDRSWHAWASNVVSTRPARAPGVAT